MNIIFSLLIIVNIGFLLFFAPEKVLTSISAAAANATGLTIKMLGIYAVWLGIMSLLSASKLSQKISNVLKRPIKKLFGDMSDEGFIATTLNFSSNILGLGNAATPMGIKAAKEMKDNTYQLAMLMIINATGLQLIPTTVLSLMSEYGAINPSSIILPTLISTVISTVFGVLLTIWIFKRKPN